MNVILGSLVLAAGVIALSLFLLGKARRLPWQKARIRILPREKVTYAAAGPRKKKCPACMSPFEDGDKIARCSVDPTHRVHQQCIALVNGRCPRCTGSLVEEGPIPTFKGTALSRERISFCYRCGSEMPKNAKFCRSCGSANTDERLRCAPKSGTLGNVHFRVYHSQQVSPRTWSTLFAYAHIPEAAGAVDADYRTRIGHDIERFTKGVAKATRPVARGTALRVVPHLPGCRFNPPDACFGWEESWHLAEFRVQADPRLSGFEANGVSRGAVEFYVGPIIIGEVRIRTHFAEMDKLSDDVLSSCADAYESIFVIDYREKCGRGHRSEYLDEGVRVHCEP